MKEAMEIPYVQLCDYVTIFDADFQPASDFLMRTVPFLIHNPEIGLVQARWKFGKNILFYLYVAVKLTFNAKTKQKTKKGQTAIDNFSEKTQLFQK